MELRLSMPLSFSRRACPARPASRARRLKNNAFTLIELLLVLVILAVLAAVVVPKFTNRRQQANNSAAKTQISNFELSISQFEIDCGRFPTNDEGLQALVTQPSGVEGWNGYMKKIPPDPWGKVYIYRYPSNKPGNDYDVLSMGPDGREGTEDDITN